MIPGIDIWRAAQLMIKRYGDSALEESAARADQLAAADDQNSATTWRRIASASFSSHHDRARPGALTGVPVYRNDGLGAANPCLAHAPRLLATASIGALLGVSAIADAVSGS